MKLLLVRHGNTFAPGDKVVWVGAGEDLPLVESGREQAKRVGLVLSELKNVIVKICSGPLKRAEETAKIILSVLNDSPYFPSPCLHPSCSRVEIDSRLDEIDYGLWGGKTTEELEALGFGSALDEWNQFGKFPAEAGWNTSDETLFNSTRDFLFSLQSISQIEDERVTIAVTSNGVLRFFLKHISDSYAYHSANGSLKVRTGSLSGFEFIRDVGSPSEGYWQECFWNVLPEDVSPHLQGWKSS